MAFRQSDSFFQNRIVWILFGIWPGKIPMKYYKYFSFVYLVLSIVVFNIFLTLNLYYTPRKLDFLVKEFVFSFTEIAVVSKVYMVLFKRKKIEAIFALLDREEFLGSDEIGRAIVQNHNKYYKTYLLSYTVLCYFTYLSLTLFPVIGFIIFGNPLEELPVCKYYFLSDEMKNKYFTSFFTYQALALYTHMMYNVHIDTLIAGFILLAVGQVKLLCHDLENLKTEKSDAGDENTDYAQRLKLRKVVNHYNLVLQYCADFQEVISGTVFVQFGLGAGIICIAMVALQLKLTVEEFMFMVGYLMAMNLEVFVPSWLGTQLTYESHEMMVAAYKGEWLPRSKLYKSSLKLLVERAKQPVVITGLKIFPLSLASYITIAKAAYSCFTLLRIVRDRQEQAMH